MKIVIVGAGEVGSHLAKMLGHEGGDVTVIDSDPARIAHLRSVADAATIVGNPSSIEILKSAGVQKADLFVSVYPFATQEMNIVCAILAKNLGAKKVTARINDENFLNPENKILFKDMGIELLFYPEKIAAEEIVDQLRHSGSSEYMDFAHGKLQIAVFKIEEDSQLLDLKLGEFVAKVGEAAENFRIIAISRDEQTLIPRFDTKFLYHDLVFTISRREGIPTLLHLFGKSNVEVDKVMILGGSQTGEHVAKALCNQVSEIKLIDKDKARCVELSEKLDDKVQVVHGDGRNTDFLLEESIRDYDAFVAVTDNDEANILACVVAKRFGIEKTIAEVENIEYIHLAEEMGVDTVINKKLITAGRIFRFTLSGKARFVKYMSGTNAEILEYTVAPGSAITRAPLKDLGFPENAIVGGVIRGSESFIAVGDTRIEAYDRVAVFALPESVKEVDRFFK
ncbi:MAG: Trk system potassium transporter TrkA [Bacteroidales bacterium]|jgi:trk system potassium uptake protein TrkA|nr:Trk system potassium transporter TrkA [Bacteroidales bacterium]MCR5571430.1 Trk system potassium transporter TrkA [Bacteroidales bacterium]